MIIFMTIIFIILHRHYILQKIYVILLGKYLFTSNIIIIKDNMNLYYYQIFRGETNVYI